MNSRENSVISSQVVCTYYRVLHGLYREAFVAKIIRWMYILKFKSYVERNVSLTCPPQSLALRSADGASLISQWWGGHVISPDYAICVRISRRSRCRRGCHILNACVDPSPTRNPATQAKPSTKLQTLQLHPPQKTKTRKNKTKISRLYLSPLQPVEPCVR